MSRFDILTKHIPLIQKDNIGEWVFYKENDGTIEHPIQVPFVNYSEVVNSFVDDVYTFHNSNEDMELSCYVDILKDNGLEWDSVSMENVDVLNLNAQGILALIMGAVRSERFCDGALCEFFESGCILKWLRRLDTIDVGGLSNGEEEIK